jgi:hypothetical protein
MSFYREQAIKATRKPCRCYWCAETIPIGEPKICTALIWEGDFHADNFHPECKYALDKYQDEHGKDNEWVWPDSGSMKRGGTEEKE